MNDSGASQSIERFQQDEDQPHPPIVNLVQQTNFFFAGSPKQLVSQKSSTLSQLVPTIGKHHSEHGIYKKDQEMGLLDNLKEQKPMHVPMKNET